MATDTPDPNELVQMNVRVPRWVRDQLDARRSTLVDPSTKRPMSRDRWVTNAVKYALKAPRTPTVNTQRRTARPR